MLFGTLATSVLTPIQSPIRDFLRAQPACLAYAELLRGIFASKGASSQEIASPWNQPTRVRHAGLEFIPS
jgi:hypothetical protein